MEQFALRKLKVCQENRPLDTKEYDNEMTDRLFIVDGYYSGH